MNWQKSLAKPASTGWNEQRNMMERGDDGAKEGREKRDLGGRGRRRRETVVYHKVSALQTSCSNDMLTSLQLSQ